MNAPLSIHGFDRKLDEMEVSLEELKCESTIKHLPLISSNKNFFFILALIFDKVTGFVNNLIGDVVY